MSRLTEKQLLLLTIGITVLITAGLGFLIWSDFRTIDEEKVKIEDLGKRLNVALARKVQELQRYRSEFFGRLRATLGESKQIKIVGDRFVFQSEVLFPSGSDRLPYP